MRQLERVDRSQAEAAPKGQRHRARAVLLTALVLLAATAAVALPVGALGRDKPAVALLSSPDGNGYTIVNGTGDAYGYGSSGPAPGSSATQPDARLGAAPAAVAARPGSRGGWLVTRDGDVHAFGGAANLGSLRRAASADPASPVTAIAATPTGYGYWLATADGRIAGFGDARSYGDLAAVPHDGPVIALAGTPSGRGYRLATAGGSVVSFGDAADLGSPLETDRQHGGQQRSPLVALLGSATGRGYLAVAADGSTFPYGDFAAPGSLAGMQLRSPVVAAAPFSSGAGVWLLTRDGGVVALHAPFYGSVADETDPHPFRVLAPLYTSARVPVDGAAGGLVAVPCRNGAGMIVVNAILARPVADLLAAASSQGVALCASSSFRNAQQQIALRRTYCTDAFDPRAACSRPVALPGRSLHEQGLAVDFAAGPDGYAWLTTHAASFGLHHLIAFGPQTEPWHYSINGS